MKKMFIPMFAVCFAAVALLGAAVLAADDNPAAMIIKVDGKCKVQRAGKEKVVTGKFPLAWGDKVIVASGGTAVVLYGTGKKVNVTATHEVSQANGKVDGKKVSASVSSSLMDSASSKKSGELKAKSGMGGAVRAAGGGASVTLLTYLNTKTMNVRPVFAWQPSAEAGECAVSLMNEDGDEVWNTKSKDNLAAWPEDKEPLARGIEYTVTVTCPIEGEDVSTTSTCYVMTDEESKPVAEVIDSIRAEYKEGDDLIIQHMLAAQFFKEKELYTDAAEELKKLIAMDPNDTISRKALADIYFTIGDKGEANKEMETVAKIEKDSGGEDF